jgi:peptide/nickel transport system substrate-binding protein
MRSTSLRWLIAPVLAVAVFALAACGGDDNKSGGAGNKPAGVNGPGKPVDGQKKGGHMTILANGDVDYLDPGAAYYQVTYGVLSGVVRQLYSFKPTDDGSHPTPDLADGDPQISDDKKTITIKIKKGIKYSPPYGKEVKAADVKYAIERAFTPQVPNGYVNSYYNGLVGLDAFKKGKAKEISGIETPDDYTIVFHLTGEGWGDLVGALVLPASSPVPEEFAKKYDSVKGQSTYAQHVLATGPYMIKSYKPGKSIEVVRNPNWDSSTDFRPAYLDSFTLDEGNADASVATRRIVQGNSLANGDFAVPPDQLKPIVQGPKKDLLTVTPGSGMRYMGINTTIKPFDNLNVRKAIAAVLNRQAMLTTRGGPLVGSVATHMLYPTVAGFDEAGGFDGPGYDFLKNPAGDLNLAMEYMKKAGYPSGKYTGKEKILMVGVNTGGGKKNAEVAEESVSKLGFNVQLREVDSGTMYTKFCQVPKAKVPLCPNLGWIKDYADAGTIINPLWNPANIVPAGNVNFEQYKGSNLGPEIDAASKMPSGQERIDAWAALDKKITGLVLGVPYLWDNTPNVSSANVDQVNQAWNAGQFSADWSSLK